QQEHEREEFLKQKRGRVLKAGVRVANRRAKEAAALQASIDAAADDKSREPLRAQKKEADAEVLVLTEIAVDPDAEQTCVDDGFAQLDVGNNVRFITRCITALSHKVRALRSVDPSMISIAERKTTNAQLGHYELQLARFEEAGRRLARIRSDDFAEAGKKHDASTTEADKAKYDLAQHNATADIDS